MKSIKLIMVSENNNNKYYNMDEQSDGTFSVTYGRVGVTENKEVYQMDRWHSKYNEKIKKGYQDITSLKVETKVASYKDVVDKKVASLLNDLQGYSKQAILDNYTISSESVTQVQIDEAQKILNDISSLLRKRNIVNYEVDNLLKKLYITIPRKMKKVQDFLLNGDGDKKKAKEILKREQDSIDIIAGQVSMQNTAPTPDQTIEDILGVKISHVTESSIIDKVKELMKDNKDQVKNIYEVVKTDSQKNFEDQKNKSTKHWTKLLFHGSRNENWLNILKTGLKIRPSCAVTTGAMFGYGVYFADKAQKSIGYSSLRGSYWTNGSSNKGYIALYEVNTGMEYRIDSHDSELYSFNYDKLRRKGEYDSLFAKGGIDLRNNEYIIYKEEQCTIKYLIELNNK